VAQRLVELHPVRVEDQQRVCRHDLDLNFRRNRHVVDHLA